MTGLLKKLGIVLAALFALLLIAMAVLPKALNVDRFRPALVDAANRNLNGKLEMGELKLSLWGRIRVDVAGLSLSDVAGKPVVAVTDAHFHVPFLSVLKGSPELVLKMRHPVLNVVKDVSGQWNVLSLKKESATESPQAADQEVSLPAIAARSRFSMELQDADLSYRDVAHGVDSKLQNLNMKLRDLSLSRPTDIELWADLNTRVNQDGKIAVQLKGPGRIEGQAQPVWNQQRFEHLQVSAKAEFDDVEIQAQGADGTAALFQKAKGVPARLDFAGLLSEAEARIERMDIRFHNAEIQSHGTVSARPVPQSPVVQFVFSSNEVNVNEWQALIPMLKQYEIGGALQLSGEANGPSDKLTYHGQAKAEGVNYMAPRLKARPQVDAHLKIVTDQIESFTATLKAPGNEIRAEGKVVSFSQPRVDARITSNGMDLDQLIDFPAETPEQAAGASPAPGTPASPAPVAASAPAPADADGDYDALLEPLRTSKIARAASGRVDFKLNGLKAYQVAMSDVEGRLNFDRLVAELDSLAMKLWGGTLSGRGQADLKPARPAYRFTGNVNGVRLEEAVGSRFKLLKNSVIGVASLDISGEGASFNPAPALENLRSKGKFKVQNATFATIDVRKMVNEALGKALGGVAEKIPSLKDKKLKALPGAGAARYQVISSNFTTGGGKLSAPNFLAKAMPGQGIDIQGSTVLGMNDYTLKSRWDLIDTYDLTGARELAAEIGGAKVEHVLVKGGKGDQPVRFPVSVGCSLLSPCYSYTEVPQYLATIALSNVSSAATGKARQEVARQADDLLKKASPEVQEKLKDVGKGIFR